MSEIAHLCLFQVVVLLHRTAPWILGGTANQYRRESNKIRTLMFSQHCNMTDLEIFFCAVDNQTPPQVSRAAQMLIIHHTSYVMF